MTHIEQRQLLSDVVVELSREACALILLRLDQLLDVRMIYKPFRKESSEGVVAGKGANARGRLAWQVS
jgi:hypothetical protein